MTTSKVVAYVLKLANHSANIASMHQTDIISPTARVLLNALENMFVSMLKMKTYIPIVKEGNSASSHSQALKASTTLLLFLIFHIIY